MLNTEEILSDEEAKRIIATLYDKGYGLAVYMIERILGPKMTQEMKDDLIQEAFVKMIIHVEQIRTRTPREQMAYMARAVRTVALDEARRQTQRRLLDSLDNPDCPEPESPDLSPEEFCMMKEDVTEKTINMRAALARLSERDRTLLIEKYQNGRSDVEIGNMLGIKTKNVRIYIARARHKAAIYYGEEVDGKKNEHRNDVGSTDSGTEREIGQEKKSEGI